MSDWLTSDRMLATVLDPRVGECVSSMRDDVALALPLPLTLPGVLSGEFVVLTGREVST